MGIKEKLTRLAVIDPERCKPKECNLECKKACPVNKIGKDCITVTKNSKISQISEILCIGCCACQKKCPFKAITIVNLPSELTKDISHRYGNNGFKLHRLPIPRAGQVLGLVGTNGIGKSTALQILSGKIKPNLGRTDNIPEWSEILDHFKGSELQGYLSKLIGNEISAITKIQYIDKIPKALKKIYKKNILTVNEVLKDRDERGCREYYIELLCLQNILERDIEQLSGGELQRFSIAIVCIKENQIYIFDEPSSYLDVKQRLLVARAIRGLCQEGRYVIVVEHDLAILDLMSDFGCVLYGKAGGYGIISAPYSIKAAINIFLDGMIPTENMRFRSEALKFNISDRPENNDSKREEVQYSDMRKAYNNFILDIKGGSFNTSEIIVFLGENGMGKSTMVGLLAGIIEPDDNSMDFKKSISLKPQKILPKFKGTVRNLFMSKIRASFLNQLFVTEVIKPLGIEYILDRMVTELSGGELQRVAIVVCLGIEAEIYLLDEPSAYLDSDQRIAVSKVLKRFIYARNKIAFIVEHDLIVGTYLADKVIVFEGIPGVKSIATPPMKLEEGMNIFLKKLNVTFRRDPSNARPRVNKLDSFKDKQQKESNKYFFT